eukprot:TRINITY_DN1569_c1_g1_i1.p1 TRINITY_DN1569_c1_g1~~TRINITY_DN1569_c1_g1_i1.p1  ORF type:complete len:221 (+),score=60.03 TRINITY_DN1569_c1_g1_i1:259-921(+)
MQSWIYTNSASYKDKKGKKTKLTKKKKLYQLHKSRGKLSSFYKPRSQWQPQLPLPPPPPPPGVASEGDPPCSRSKFLITLDYSINENKCRLSMRLCRSEIPRAEGEDHFTWIPKIYGCWLSVLYQSVDMSDLPTELSYFVKTGTKDFEMELSDLTYGKVYRLQIFVKRPDTKVQVGVHNQLIFVPFFTRDCDSEDSRSISFDDDEDDDDEDEEDVEEYSP